MNKCSECKIKYPDDVMLSPMLTSEGSTREVCGVCALEISNKIHGVEQNEFTGEMAEQARQDALAHRKSLTH